MAKGEVQHTDNGSHQVVFIADGEHQLIIDILDDDRVIIELGGKQRNFIQYTLSLEQFEKLGLKCGEAIRLKQMNNKDLKIT